jgi:hypothetical protein
VWAAAALVAAGCSHENPPTPVPVLHAIDVSVAALETREGGVPATFDVVLRSRPSAPVDLEVRSGDATEGLVLAPGYAAPGEARGVSFTPSDWDVPRRVTVHPVEDDVADGSVHYSVALRVAFSEDPIYAAVPPVAVRVTNADVDVRGIVVSATTATTSESGLIADFGVRLASRPSSSLTVVVESMDPSEGLVEPDWGGALSAVNLWFDVMNWAQPQRIRLRGVDDPFTDGPRTYQVTLRTEYLPAEDPWSSVPTRYVDVTNLDDEVAAVTVLPHPAPLLTFERGTSASFEVVLNESPLEDVLVPVTSEDWTEGLVSAAGQPPAASVTLTFTPATYWQPQTVTVVGQDDVVPGDDVAYAVSVGPPAGLDPVYPALPAQVVAVLNLDDDDAGFWIPEAATTLQTDEWQGAASFTIVLRKPPATDVAVPVSVGDPAEGLVRGGSSPFDPQPLVTVTFTPLDWDVPQTITVVGQRDDVVDGTRTYLVTVGPGAGDPDYAAIAPVHLTVTNADRSVAGFQGSSQAMNLHTTEGLGAVWFTLRLATRPYAPVAVPIVSGDPSEGLLGADQAGPFDPSLVLTFTAADWDVEQRVWIHGPPDGVVDGTRWYQITMGPASSADPVYDGLPVWWVLDVWNNDVD